MYAFNTYSVLVLLVCLGIYFVRKDVGVDWGMMEDSQLFSLAIPAPVLDGRSSVGDRVEAPRKYWTQGLRVPL